MNGSEEDLPDLLRGFKRPETTETPPDNLQRIREAIRSHNFDVTRRRGEMKIDRPLERLSRHVPKQIRDSRMRVYKYLRSLLPIRVEGLPSMEDVRIREEEASLSRVFRLEPSA